MKITFTFFLFLVSNSIAFCQATPKNKIKAGVGISLAIPVYNLTNSATGGGIDAMIQYGICENLSLTADAGFTGLPGKGRFPSTAIVPVRIGVRYFPQSKFYVGAKAGLGIYTILKASANHFAFSAASGYFLGKKIDAALFYDGYSNEKTSFGYLGVRIGYNF